MTVRIRETDLHIHNVRTRMPFKYGIATLTVVPHLFVRVHAEIDGKPAIGIAADSLPPKWFTKDPATTMAHDIEGMIDVIRAACQHAKEIDSVGSVFSFWHRLYIVQKEWAQSRTANPAYPPLLWNFGVSLVERALIDAFCRATNTNFHRAVHTNTLGIDLGMIHTELQRTAPTDFLPKAPRQRTIARHTVGLADPLTNSEIPPAERLNDGLPQSLAACIHAYGLTHFKIKVSGAVDNDLARIAYIISVLEQSVRGNYAFTLDGNEQYKSINEFRTFWQKLSAKFPAFLGHLLFVEQPLHRDVALHENVALALADWPDHPPLIIDEADESVESLPTALALGYQGTSHKNCKGIFKGIANACLVAYHRQHEPAQTYLLSGEDLINVGPVALLQDLAVLATLGVDHVERNGHHYCAGLSMFPATVQAQVAYSHDDLYQKKDDLVAVAIHDGRVNLRSVVDAPFGIGFDLDVTKFTPVDEWQFASLGVTT